MEFKKIKYSEIKEKMKDNSRNRHFNDEDETKNIILMKSIKTNGVVNPLLFKKKEEELELVSGRRRLKAIANLLKNDNLQDYEVPVLILEQEKYNDSYLLSYAENNFRTQLKENCNYISLELHILSKIKDINNMDYVNISQECDTLIYKISELQTNNKEISFDETASIILNELQNLSNSLCIPMKKLINNIIKNHINYYERVLVFSYQYSFGDIQTLRNITSNNSYDFLEKLEKLLLFENEELESLIVFLKKHSLYLANLENKTFELFIVNFNKNDFYGELKEAIRQVNTKKENYKVFDELKKEFNRIKKINLSEEQTKIILNFLKQFKE
ncbi:ParB/RepB/Spo0J family partition protein [Campylobacter canadensis]|uniref:ParB/RepB/Spo0J family partition protein n=1 Tax=Campylobacter canadensis TaxID=449520 RepID=UPI001CCE7A8A|nr:ParB/RepB/Spo0J family partition protein [Campylobacter canadensis]MBZ8002692.1 ParB N-terminal domain-containing protein [Campylobacter canadensis]